MAFDPALIRAWWRGGRRLRASRALVLALVCAVALVLVATEPGLAADPAAPDANQAAHDAAVAAAVEAAVSGDARASASAAAGAGLPGAAPASTPTPSSTTPPQSTSATAGRAALAGGASMRPVPVGTPSTTPGPQPTPTPTPTPMPTVTPPPRPATVDAPVPSTVLSSLGSVASDLPPPYRDGCHVSMGGVMPSKSCLYGNLKSHTTIAIYGDSHALSWFPAILRAANDKGWRVLEVTMSACVPADIIPYYPATHSVMTACVNFRKAAIAKLAKYHPAVIFVTGTRGFQTVNSSGRVLTGSAKTNAWIRGMQRTLARLIPIASRVVMVADTPNSRYANPAACIAANPRHELACTTPVSSAVNYSWLNTEYHVALSKHVAFIDPELWVCPTSPCPSVRGNFVVHRNGGHLTAKYAATMWKKAEAALVAVLAQPGAVIGP